MVFLSLQRWIRCRTTERRWRVLEELQYARHFRGRKNRCYSLAIRNIHRAFVKATKARKLKKRFMRTLWITRIEAASLEHGLKYPGFISNLAKCQPKGEDKKAFLMPLEMEKNQKEYFHVSCTIIDVTDIICSCREGLDELLLRLHYNKRYLQKSDNYYR
ncbi:39S ribosomal protein L20, mitochondrial [Alligator mississippiensis]|uniref:39S ribosomal protein L20, mitochondrial n=1 Tax=Alligator mississippiensis TaxID=8496 RepID=A0A151N458_ALLMI|nr:39S ribosomal protein L20, mitochondrial [Alligator mississippiensis]